MISTKDQGMVFASEGDIVASDFKITDIAEDKVTLFDSENKKSHTLSIAK